MKNILRNILLVFLLEVVFGSLTLHLSKKPYSGELWITLSFWTTTIITILASLGNLVLGVVLIKNFKQVIRFRKIGLTLFIFNVIFIIVLAIKLNLIFNVDSDMECTGSGGYGLCPDSPA